MKRLRGLIARKLASAAGTVMNPRDLIPSSKRGRVLVGTLAVLLVAGALSPLAIGRLTGLPDDAAFRVGDRVVTEQEFDDRIELLSALYGIQRPAGEKEQGGFRRNAAKAIAVSIVLENAARERGIVIPEKAARDTLSTMIEQRFGPSGREQFINLLGTKGASEHDVIEEIQRQRGVMRLFQDVAAEAKSKITDEMLRDYYTKHKKEMVIPERRHLRNIVVANKKDAHEVLTRARTGTNFGNLVLKYSLDASTRETGGDLGTVAHDDLAEGYADAAFGAQAGTVFGPVQTKHGWNVGQIVEIVPATELPLGQVKNRIRELLKSENALKAWRAWLAGQIREADVEYADQYRPADPDAPPAGPASPLAPGVNSPQNKEQPR